MHTWRGVNYRVRLATHGDEPALLDLIARSIRELGANDYTPEQIEAALTGAFGIDTSLIRDGTYFVVVTERAEIVGCGGWSRRRTLFGSDARVDRDEAWLDPRSDPAKVRAPYAKQPVTNYALGSEFFVTPSLPLRFGVFTNNDARPKVATGVHDTASGQTCANLDYYKKYCAQPDHIDYYGESLFIAWVQPNSQISAGVTMQQGTGKAQKLGDDKVQAVKSKQYSFAFSATHNL